VSRPHRFPFEKHHVLDGPERRRRQPAEPLVALAADGGPRRILDLGAGTGFVTLALARALPSARIVAADADPRMCLLLSRRVEDEGLGGRVAVLNATAGAAPLPLPAGSMDVVLCVNLYHEIAGRIPALADVLRLLGPSGRLILCDWDPAGDAGAGPPPEHRVGRALAERELAAAGFGRVLPHAPYPDHWVLVAQR